ncbi:MAG TPA: alanine racemase [Gemmatimonadaceae bacterium]|nr:alanine racemase [Gemmatimonadaceae bacterium]
MSDVEIYRPPLRAWIEVDLGALRRNAVAVQRRAQVPLIPMVKADAYGLGARAVVGALESGDGLTPWGYGVATVKEGEALRRSGVTRPIVVFTPLLHEEFAAAHAANLIPTLGTERDIRVWGGRDGGRFGAPYHLAIDTGMNRAGIPWREVGELRTVVREIPPAGAFTHLHSAELYDGSAEQEEQLFREALGVLGVEIPFLHVDNSAAIVRYDCSSWSAIRPGVFLYGVGSGSGAKLQPEPVAHIRARVVETRWIEAGDTVSYDATYIAPKRQRIATVAVGYGDGYPRALSNRGKALLHGKRIDVRGRVTMDMTMFDVTSVPCEVGDVVTLMGRDHEQLLTAEDLSAMAELSPYELLTGLSVRLDRVYHS